MQLGFLTSGTVADVRFAARHGFGCLELALFGDTPLLADSTEFQAALAAEGISLVAVSLFGQNYRDADPKKRTGYLDRLERVADLAAELGSPILVTGSGSTPGVLDAEQWDAIVEEMAGPIEGIQKRGLRFAFYNCHWVNAIHTPAAWDHVLPRLPGVGVKFDPSHPVYENRDWMPELIAAGPHLVHAHAKDVLRVAGKLAQDPNPGLGEIAWGPFFALLYAAGYDGAVCIEPHSQLYAGEKRYQFLVLSQRYLQQFLLPDLG